MIARWALAVATLVACGSHENPPPERPTGPGPGTISTWKRPFPKARRLETFVGMDQLIRVAGDDVQTAVTTMSSPPTSAAFLFCIDASGKVDYIEMIPPMPGQPFPPFAGQALRIIRGWRFVPYSLSNGPPIAVCSYAFVSE